MKNQFQKKEILSPIVISVDYSNFNKFDFEEIPETEQKFLEKQNYVKDKLIPQTLLYFGSFLEMNKNYTFKMPSNKCNTAKVPYSHQNIGISQHIIFYLTYTYDFDQYIFWSNTCVRNKDTNQPLAIQLNVNFNSIYIRQNEEQFNFNALVHEILHSIGFSQVNLNLMSSYGDKFLLNETHFWFINENQQKVQKYFECQQQKIYFKIESYQKNFHWDRIQMMNDFMTAQILPNIVFSAFDLDLLKLSGWFYINEDFYNKTQIQYKWGKGLGCDFINNFEQFYQDQLKNKKDNQENMVYYQNNDQNQYLQKGLNVKKKQKPDQNIISNSYGYENTKLNSFCDRNNFNNFQGGCSYDYSYFATCNQDQYSDGYFYMIPSYNGSCYNVNQNYHYDQSIQSGENFQINSRCVISNITVPENSFDQDLYIDHLHNEQNENELNGQNKNNINQKQKQNQANQLMSKVRCYEAYCNKDKTSITFIIYKKNQKINLVCKKDYQIIKDNFLFDGQLNCPKISDFCLYASDQSCNADKCQQQYNNKIKDNFNEIILGNLKKSFYCKDSKCLSQVSYE